MPSLPGDAYVLAVRTDFSDETRWRGLCEAVTRGYLGTGHDEPMTTFLSDPDNNGATVEDLVAADRARSPADTTSEVLFIADAEGSVR